jgi:citrate/tricarballylate utilization protein
LGELREERRLAMPLHDLMSEANRQLTICNACRYCEGFCAVFPALELRKTFDEGDVLYLSNLCHDCRDCYTACMYAAPHEFDLNIPAVLSEVRLDVYQRYASPRAFGNALRNQNWAVGGTVVASILLVVLVAMSLHGPGVFTSVHSGPGAFYKVLPYALLWTVFMAISLYVVVVWIVGTVKFWRDTDSPLRGSLQVGSLLRATGEALTLRYLCGGGAGCDYPGPNGSYSRLILHSLVSYGFLAAFAATILAAIYQDLFGILPPFPIVSAPVLVGSAGGLGVITGATGLLYLKFRADPVPAFRKMMALDYAFLVLLDLVALTGMILLVVRDNSLMTPLLTVHLGTVIGLFLTAPYGKFVHFVYRSAALVQNQLEQTHAVD